MNVKNVWLQSNDKINRVCIGKFFHNRILVEKYYDNVIFVLQFCLFGVSKQMFGFI